ncbi:hypothetical protein SSS_06350 [Sarcoptes scabiei]|uniref:Uncharacterized protein n=1 Tax=Sarcoptes scabiei TaxID=52283 RepID=A0A834R1P0_SARSC|nr:hypothetical protein SSS_06350 [Sarcoptes scabiei]
MFKRFQVVQNLVSLDMDSAFKWTHFGVVSQVHELLSQDLQITHVVDLTICYDHPDTVPSIIDVIKGTKASPDRLSPTLRKRENSSPFKMQLENGRSHSNEINQKQSIGSQTIQDHSVDSSDSQKNVADNLKFRSYHFFSDLKFDPNDPDRRSVELSFCKVLVLHLGFFMVSFVFCIGVGLIVSFI